MASNNLVKVVVEAAVALKVLRNLETFGHGLLTLFNDIERAEALVFVDRMLGCVRVAHLEHRNDDVVPPGRSEEHIPQGVNVDDVQGAGVVGIGPVSVPDVPRTPHPVLKRLPLLGLRGVYDSKLGLRPVLALQRHEEGGVVVADRELPRPEALVCVHRQDDIKGPAWSGADVDDARDHALAPLELAVAVRDISGLVLVHSVHLLERAPHQAWQDVHIYLGLALPLDRRVLVGVLHVYLHDRVHDAAHADVVLIVPDGQVEGLLVLQRSELLALVPEGLEDLRDQQCEERVEVGVVRERGHPRKVLPLIKVHLL
mmetsp:Transcript_97667/g.271782  ORF Transcript_97667/g.271782 Transcript_97667/m.271782 type:complete len:314 (+) Transcript_97667:662-1603(+)